MTPFSPNPPNLVKQIDDKPAAQPQGKQKPFQHAGSGGLQGGRGAFFGFVSLEAGIFWRYVGRIRSLKPEFWKHPVICRLPDDFQLLAISLLSMADDEGYFHADSSIVRGEVMPFRESLARIREGLDKLAEVGWIELARIIPSKV